MAKRLRRWNGTSWEVIFDHDLYAQLAFSNIAVSGQTTVAAATNGSTLTLAAGTGVTLTTNAGTSTVTVAIGQSVATTASPTFAGVSAAQLTSTTTTLAPLVVSSATEVANLRSATATALATARTFSLTGNVTATGISFTGAANVALSTTIASGVITNSMMSTTAGEQGGALTALTISATSNATGFGGFARGRTVGKMQFIQIFITAGTATAIGSVTITLSGITAYNTPASRLQALSAVIAFGTIGSAYITGGGGVVTLLTGNGNFSAGANLANNTISGWFELA